MTQVSLGHRDCSKDLSSYLSSSVAPSVYMHVAPLSVQNEHDGFALSHLVFLRRHTWHAWDALLRGTRFDRLRFVGRGSLAPLLGRCRGLMARCVEAISRFRSLEWRLFQNQLASGHSDLSLRIGNGNLLRGNMEGCSAFVYPVLLHHVVFPFYPAHLEHATMKPQRRANKTPIHCGVLYDASSCMSGKSGILTYGGMCRTARV